MLRQAQQQGPGPEMAQIGAILAPLQVYSWGPSALHHLGVPVVLNVPMVVVREQDYEKATQILVDAGFIRSTPNRKPAPEILETLPDPDSVMREIHAGFKRLDEHTRTFDYPSQLSKAVGSLEQITLIPSSYVSLSWDSTATQAVTAEPYPNPAYNTGYFTYRNIHYPHQRTLLGSIIRTALDERNSLGFTSWAALLSAWASMMVGYLGLENDCLDECPDEEVVTWYSTKFGRIREAKYGPLDHRISKRVGSGKEMPVDMSGRPLPEHHLSPDIS